MLENLNSSLILCSEDRIEVKKDVEEKIYQDILNHCNEFQTNFIDDQFPHSIRSIGVFEKESKNIAANSLQWTRPTHICTEEDDQWTVLNNPSPSDIEQGTLVGDCWLMSAMAVIAEKTNILDDIFPSKEYSHQGVYRVKLCVEGEWKVIIVDDFLPCYEGNEMAMAVGRRNQLWVALIEKAAAKAMGSYSMLHGASLTQGLSMLTGADCKICSTSEDPTKVETFWGQLVSSKSSGFIMCCSCGEKSDEVKNDEDFRAKGLLTNHAYSILDVDDQYGYRLLRVRNPWGHFVWNGNWSDDWEHWPAEMRENLLTNRIRETGEFWIELNDFLKMFHSVTICKIRSNWNEFRHSQIVGIDQPSLQINVTETCEVSFVAFQKGSFAMKEDSRNDMMFSVHRISSDCEIGPMVSRSSRLSGSHVSIYEFFLNPGQYVVMCFNLKNSNPLTINLVCYSSKQIFFDTIRLSSKMFYYALRKIVLRDGEVVNNMETGTAIRTLTKNFSGMIIMADNFLNNRWLHLEVNCNGSMNIKSSRNSLQSIDVIPPMSYAILHVLSKIDELGEDKVKFEFESTRSENKHIDPEKIFEASIIPELQNWPMLDYSDPLHSSHSLFYDT